MKAIVFVLVISLCWRNNESLEIKTSEATIPPCLIPPFQNLVYNYEAAVKGRPGIRTGCYVQADSNGSVIPPFTVFPLETAKPLQYYVIDGTGKKNFVAENGTVSLQLYDGKGNVSEMGQNFTFHRICFPILCYSSLETYARSCYDPFPVCSKCDSENSDQSSTSSEIPHLGEANLMFPDTWVYCKKEQEIVPIMTLESPFGELKKLIREPYELEDKREKVVLTIKNTGPPGTIRAGCSLIFPLRPPFNTYIHRFWYQDYKDGSFKTITEDQSVVVQRNIHRLDCEKYKPEFGERACTEKSWLETFTFRDFCFPQECYIDKMLPCTGKAAESEKRWKMFTVTFHDERGPTMLNLNSRFPTGHPASNT